MNSQTSSQVCSSCNTPTFLGCDCLAEHETPRHSDDEVRFSPVDDEAARLESFPVSIETESGAISQETIFAPARNSPSAYRTFVERPRATETLSARNIFTDRSRMGGWLRTASLVAIAAFFGGFAVFMFTPQRDSIAETPTVNTQPATLSSSESLLPKPSNESGADERLVPATVETVDTERSSGSRENRQVIASQKRTESAPTSSSEISPVLEPDSSDPEPTTANAEPQKEAKVGAYVAEKPSGKNPLARCADGTYSYSASRSAACSQRGGVSEWIGSNEKTAEKPAGKQAAYILGPRGGCYYLDSANKKVYVEKKYCN